jgi:hypothetical protein
LSAETHEVTWAYQGFVLGFDGDGVVDVARP